eukprot:UN22805
MGPKICILFQFAIMMLFVASFMYPRVYTVYPAAALLGTFAAPLWVGQGDYVNWLSRRHAALTDKDNKNIRQLDVIAHSKQCRRPFTSNKTSGKFIIYCLFDHDGCWFGYICVCSVKKEETVAQQLCHIDERT